MLGRNPFAKMKAKNAGNSCDEEKQSMLAGNDDIQLFHDPASYTMQRSKRGYERHEHSPTYSSPDSYEELQPLLVDNRCVVTYTTCRPVYRRKSIVGLEWTPPYVSLRRDKVQSLETIEGKPTKEAVLPEMILKDEDLKFGKRDGISVSPEKNSGEKFLGGHQKISEMKSAGSRLQGDDLRDNTVIRKANIEERVDTLNLRAPNLYGVGNPKKCVVSVAKRAIWQITTAKNELVFSDILSENRQFSQSKSFRSRGTPHSLICDEIKTKSEAKSKLGLLADSGHQMTKSTSEIQVYRKPSEEQDVSEDPCGAIEDGRELVSDSSKRGEHFGDAQSERSFVLVVDHLTDIRVRNMFVRRHAGRRRLAVCEELEKVIVCNGACLLELRNELNIEHVLNNMFMT